VDYGFTHDSQLGSCRCDIHRGVAVHRSSWVPITGNRCQKQPPSVVDCGQTPPVAVWPLK